MHTHTHLTQLATECVHRFSWIEFKLMLRGLLKELKKMLSNALLILWVYVSMPELVDDTFLTFPVFFQRMAVCSFLCFSDVSPCAISVESMQTRESSDRHILYTKFELTQACQVFCVVFSVIPLSAISCRTVRGNKPPKHNSLWTYTGWGVIHLLGSFWNDRALLIDYSVDDGSSAFTTSSRRMVTTSSHP